VQWVHGSYDTPHSILPLSTVFEDIVTRFFQIGEMLLQEESEEMWKSKCYECEEEVDCAASVANAIKHAQACCRGLDSVKDDPIYHCLACRLLIFQESDLQDHLKKCRNFFHLLERPRPLKIIREEDAL
jgi:hypothetical protein